MSFPFAFAWLNALHAVIHSHSLSDPFLCLVTQANQKLTAFLNITWKEMNSKGLNAMPAISKILVLLALVLFQQAMQMHSQVSAMLLEIKFGSII